MRLIFEERTLAVMYAWLEEHYPEEACGFLLGHEDGDIRTITETWPATNVSQENRKQRFIVDPLDYLKAEKKAVELKLSLLGIYHSHPDHPAIPSKHDLAAAHPFFSYTIVSVRNGQIDDIRSYQLKDNEFVSEEVRLQTKEQLHNQETIS